MYVKIIKEEIMNLGGGGGEHRRSHMERRKGEVMCIHYSHWKFSKNKKTKIK